ncbi:unnamed protein product [Enterobius vermicularis]|uniref:BRO1 domain-containing protein n=1 Tax=Enterobius vermicularis TaxID=51028 RepID=A0A0N4UVS2_ENTVE|nr:unnamed protein product [Enterobius vermicularis]
MDGMPRLPMIHPDFKYANTTSPEFSTKIKEYILSHYEDDPGKYEGALSELESLRAKLSSFLPDVETVCQVKRYYAQLRMMKSRFPMEEGDPLHISFSWCDRNGDSNSCTYADVDFELACVMYDIGVIHASIAASESRIEPDSIKNAFTHFQCAAYPFQYIRDKMNASKYSVFSFDNNILTWYCNIMLAQAQECLLEKSLIDHRKNMIVAKLAVYLRDIYKQCGELLEESRASEFFSSSKYKEWARTCKVKSELYGAVAMLSMGDKAEEDKKMGVRLAFYELAEKSALAALSLAEKDKRENVLQAVAFMHDVTNAKFTSAKKDNDFVYHDIKPKFEELPTVEPVPMVKPLAFDPTDRSVCGDDLFAAVLPMNVLKAVSVYAEEKAKFRRSILEKVAIKDQDLEAHLVSLRLEDIDLDASVDEVKLPDSLLEKSAAFNAQPDAFNELLEKLKKVGNYAAQAEEKLSSLSNRLAAIDLPSLKSDEAFVATSNKLATLTEKHTQARENNIILQKKIASHSEALRNLALPLPELSRRIVGFPIRPSETPEGAKLRKALRKTEEMKKQRESFVKDLTNDLDNDDITAKCLAEKDFDNSDLFKKELAKHEKTVKLIDLNLDAQEKILSCLIDANAEFAACRREIMKQNDSRKDQILALTAAYEVYCTVLQKADEGLKFYDGLFKSVDTVERVIKRIEESCKKAALESARIKAEEHARKLKASRDAEGIMRQFSSESSEVRSITAETQGMVTPIVQNLPGYMGNTVGNQFRSPNQGSCASSFPPTSARQSTVPFDGAVVTCSAPMSTPQFPTTLPGNCSNVLPQQPMHSMKDVNNGLLNGVHPWSNQIIQPTSGSMVPTVYSQPYRPIQSAANPLLQGQPPVQMNTNIMLKTDHYAGQTTPRSCGQSQPVVSVNVPASSVQVPQTYSRVIAPTSGCPATNLSMQQSCSGLTPQIQMMDFSIPLASFKYGAAFQQYPPKPLQGQPGLMPVNSTDPSWQLRQGAAQQTFVAPTVPYSSYQVISFLCIIKECLLQEAILFIFSQNSMASSKI